jgi:hypothetical protein
MIKMLASLRDLFDVLRDICYLNSAYSPPKLRTQDAARGAVGRDSRACHGPAHGI